MIYSLFREINCLLFARIFICCLIFIEITGVSRYNVQCLYLLLYSHLFTDCSNVETNLAISIFWLTLRGNLGTLRDRILIKQVFVKYDSLLYCSSSVERLFSRRTSLPIESQDKFLPQQHTLTNYIRFSLYLLFFRSNISISLIFIFNANFQSSNKHYLLNWSIRYLHNLRFF